MQASSSAPNSDAYWDIAFQVMGYAVDTSLTQPIKQLDKELFDITEDVFLNDLYVRREHIKLEVTLLSEMLRSVPVVCLTADRGCGKTSALRFALREVRRHSPSTRPILYDIKRAWHEGIFQGLSLENAGGRFRRAIYNRVKMELFPQPPDTRRLLAWLLAGPPDPTDDFDHLILNEFSSDFDWVQPLAIPGGVDEILDRQAKFERLHAEFIRSGKLFSDVVMRLQPKLRIAHLVAGARRLRPDAFRVLLVLDNVDRIPAKFQPLFMQEVNDGQLSMGSSCTTVIAIRRENIKGLEKRPGDGGDLLVIVSPQHERFDGMLLPPVTAEHTRNVLERRRELSRTIFRSILRDLETASNEVEVDSEQEAQIVHAAVVNQFVHDAVYDLANGSLRAVVSIYNAFIQSLLRLSRSGEVDLHEILKGSPGDGHLQTLLFLWIRKEGELHEIPLYDLLRRSMGEDPPPGYAAGADVRHLLLTTVLNLTPSKTGFWEVRGYPQFSVVAARLNLLGFEIDEIKRALEEMCARPGEAPKTIEFVDSEADLEGLTEVSTERLRITPLGRTLVESVCSKVGYIWEQASEEAPSQLRGGKRSYHQLTREQRVRVVEHHLVARAERHLKLLCHLSDGWYQLYGDRWLDRYRVFFGVRGELQVERLLLSAEKFFFSHTDGRLSPENPFSATLRGYRSLLLEVVRRKPFRLLDLRLMQKPRRQSRRRR